MDMCACGRERDRKKRSEWERKKEIECVFGRERQNKNLYTERQINHREIERRERERER